MSVLLLAEVGVVVDDDGAVASEVAVVDVVVSSSLVTSVLVLE